MNWYEQDTFILEFSHAARSLTVATTTLIAHGAAYDVFLGHTSKKLCGWRGKFVARAVPASAKPRASMLCAGCHWLCAQENNAI